jgi:hypothetical protein
MRKLFLALAKLVGLLQLYSGVVTLVQVGGYIVTSGASVSVNAAFLVEMVAFFAVAMAVAWVLLARTDWLADKLGIPDEPEITGLEREPLLFVGVTLIGLYVVIHAIPALAGEVVELGPKGVYQIEGRLWSKIASSLVQLGLGLLLMLRPTKVIEMITQRKAETEPTDVS